MHTKQIGNISEAAVALYFLKQGKTVLEPIGDNAKYDLVIEEFGVFQRVQVKTGRLNNGTIVFNAFTVNPTKQDGKYQKVFYHGQADLFGVYCPETDQVYIVNVADVTAHKGRIKI